MSHPTDHKQPFWETKSLEQMTDAEWESLCDRCGRCCMQKLQDEETDEVYYTNLVCHLFDHGSGACSDYPNRLTRVPGCVKLTRDLIPELFWLPASCAYRRLSEGRGLAHWHPLVSGRQQTVIDAGVSVLGRVIPETDVPEEDWEEHIVNWID